MESGRAQEAVLDGMESRPPGVVLDGGGPRWRGRGAVGGTPGGDPCTGYWRTTRTTR